MLKHDEAPTENKLPYAVDEVTFPVLARATVWLILLSIFSFGLAGGAYWFFVVHETAVQPSRAMLATPIPPDPNVPILQKNPEAEMHKFRADEYDKEHSYAHWNDGDGKPSLRVPVSRAMEIVKARGLTRATNETAQPEVNGKIPAGATSYGNGTGGVFQPGVPKD